MGLAWRGTPANLAQNLPAARAARHCTTASELGFRFLRVDHRDGGHGKNISVFAPCHFGMHKYTVYGIARSYDYLWTTNTGYLAPYLAQMGASVFSHAEVQIFKCPETAK